MAYEFEYCDKCGKCMSRVDENGKVVENWKGFSFRITGEGDDDKREYINKQLGKYAGKDKIQICFECWLDTFLLE
ncbi:MAG: hypothetical protein MUP81_02270 [Dehalococcoidia bacterium]|nr:hypothetical protein [Dehalococcoidia bacterium]